MNTPTSDRRDYRFALGVLAGTAIGAGLVMWLAPRATSELRARVADAAKDLGQRGQTVRDDVADVVARSAHEVARGARGVARGAGEVETFAVAAKSDRS